MLKQVNIILFAAAAILLSGCSGAKEVQSAFSDSIKVDGEYGEWGNKLVPIKNENIAIGFVHNNEFLYMSIVTSDRDKIRKIIGNGLTIWVKSSEGEIGIRYPMKMDPSQMMQMRTMRQGDGQQRMDNFENMLKGREDLQVITKDEMPLYTALAESGNSFRAKINVTTEQMVYELQIPIKNNDITSGIFTKDVTEAKVTLKTNEFDRSQMQQRGVQRGGDEGPGVMGPGGMGPGGRGNRPDGMGHGERQGMDFKALEYTFKVKL